MSRKKNPKIKATVSVIQNMDAQETMDLYLSIDGQNPQEGNMQQDARYRELLAKMHEQTDGSLK